MIFSKKKVYLKTGILQKFWKTNSLSENLIIDVVQVVIPKVELPSKPVPLIIDDSGRTVDSTG